MLSPALLQLNSKPSYQYESKLGWEQVRPMSGGVNEALGEQFIKAQGEENFLPSLLGPEVRGLLQAETHIERNVVLAYHADEARAQMDEALDTHAGAKWKQGESSLSAPKPGDNDGFFSAYCGGGTYNQCLTINSKDQHISLRTSGKQDGHYASQVVSAHYDPATGEIFPATVTSDFNWNIGRL